MKKLICAAYLILLAVSSEAATLEVAIGEAYGPKLMKIGNGSFMAEIDGKPVRRSLTTYTSFMQGTHVNKTGIEPGRHTITLCLGIDCATQEIDVMEEGQTVTVGFVYHYKEQVYKKVAQIQGISYSAKFDKNKYDAYMETVKSERGVQRLLDTIYELNHPQPKPEQKKNIQPGSQFDK